MFAFDEIMQQLKKRLESHDTQMLIIDVRETDEYKQGHIPQALLYPLSKLREEYTTLPKNIELYVYCRSGQRSQAACRILQELGYTKLKNAGGIIHWKGKQEGGLNEKR